MLRMGHFAPTLTYTQINKYQCLMNPKDILNATDGGRLIFEKILGVEISTKKSYKIRNERTASTKFKIDKMGRWIINDFGNPNYSDAIDYVMNMLGVSKQKACQYIQNLLNIENNEAYLKNIFYKHTIKNRPIIKSIYDCKERAFNKIDIEYWKQFNIRIGELQVIPISCYNFKKYEDDTLIKEFTVCQSINNLLMYAIYFNSENVKIYQPENKNRKNKCIGSSNKEDVFGLNDKNSNLNKSYDKVFIASGQKDREVLRIHFDRMNKNYHVVSFNSETSPPHKNKIGVLQNMGPLYSIYDNDKEGFIQQKKLESKYFIKPINLSSYTDQNDISDFCKYDYNNFLKFINNL